MSVEIELENLSEAGNVPSKADFQRWAEATLSGFRLCARVAVRIVGEAESQALNARYRDRDRPTNVLSFPAEDLPGEWASFLGDLVLCAPLVEVEADAAGVPAEHHWAHLTIHGCLHLLGFDHEAEVEAERMEGLEVELLARFGIADPYVPA